MSRTKSRVCAEIRTEVKDRVWVRAFRGTKGKEWWWGSNRRRDTNLEREFGGFIFLKTRESFLLL